MATGCGAFIWYELMTTDPEGAGGFYGKVIGWRFSPPDPSSPLDYRHITRDDGGSAGGVLPLAPESQAGGAHPSWMPYLQVADVDSAAAAIVDEGGRLLMPAMTIAVGTIAMVADPQGVPFYIMAPIPMPGHEGESSDVFSPDKPQHVRWNELASPDLDAAKAFYADHFGFEFNSAMPMGELGDYCFIEHDGKTLGAIMQRPDPDQPALWLPYFGVPSTLAARDAIEQNGGTVMMGPHEVPGGDWIVVATDPQGAVFGVVGPKGG